MNDKAIYKHTAAQEELADGRKREPEHVDWVTVILIAAVLATVVYWVLT